MLPEEGKKPNKGTALFHSCFTCATMTAEMKSFYENPLQFILYLALSAFILFLAAFFFVNFKEDKEADRIRLQYEINGLSNRLWENFILNMGEPDSELLAPPLLGFGIYDFLGNALYIHGTAPQKLIIENSFRGYITLNKKEETLRLLRPIGFGEMMPIKDAFSTPRIEMPRRMHAPRRFLKDHGRIILVDYDLNEHFTETRFRNALLLLFLLFFIALFLTIILLNKELYGMQKTNDRQKRLAQLGEAARTLTHEIKNPLSTLKLQESLLRKKLGTEYQESLNMIKTEVQRISALTSRVTDFLKNPEGNPEVIGLKEFLTNTFNAREKTVHFQWEAPDSVEILFDPDNFRSVMENLLNNAEESMEGGIIQPVHVRVRREKEKLAIEITDKGKGIDHKELEKIFDPFYTTKTTGSGVGLAITKRFVEAAEGQIHVYSGPQGTRVRLLLRKVQ